MRIKLWGVLCGTLVCAACSQADSLPPPDGAPPAAGIVASAGMELAHADAVVRVGAMPAPLPRSPSIERMIVRSASMTLQVSDVRKTVDAVERATGAADGFLGTSRLWREGEQQRASMTLRVPSARLDATLASLRALAVRVDDESVSGEDVTRQAVDLRAQVTNLRATEVELRALLQTVREKTKRAADVLEVHAELTRVRGEIDRMEAELQSLVQLAALSTITLDLSPDVVATPIASQGWQPRGVLRDATRALVGTLRVTVNGAIWVGVYAVPLLLLTALVVMAVRRLLRRAAASRPVTAAV